MTRDFCGIRPACQSSGSDPTQPEGQLRWKGRGWSQDTPHHHQDRASGPLPAPPAPAAGWPLQRLVWGSFRPWACPGLSLLLAVEGWGATQSSPAPTQVRKALQHNPWPPGVGYQHLWGGGVKPRPLELVPTSPSRGTRPFSQRPHSPPLVWRPSRLPSRTSLCHLGKGEQGWVVSAPPSPQPRLHSWQARTRHSG